MRWCASGSLTWKTVGHGRYRRVEIRESRCAGPRLAGRHSACLRTVAGGQCLTSTSSSRGCATMVTRRNLPSAPFANYGFLESQASFALIALCLQLDETPSPRWILAAILDEARR